MQSAFLGNAATTLNLIPGIAPALVLHREVSPAVWPVGEDSRRLWIVLVLNDVVSAVGGAHEMRLRSAAHPTDMLDCLKSSGHDDLWLLSLRGSLRVGDRLGI